MSSSHLQPLQPDYAHHTYIALTLLPTVPPTSLLTSPWNPPPTAGHALYYCGKVGHLPNSHLYELRDIPTQAETRAEVVELVDWLVKLEGVSDVEVQRLRQRAKRGVPEQD